MPPRHQLVVSAAIGTCMDQSLLCARLALLMRGGLSPVLQPSNGLEFSLRSTMLIDAWPLISWFRNSEDTPSFLALFFPKGTLQANLLHPSGRCTSLAHPCLCTDPTPANH